MSDIKLFSTAASSVTELRGHAVALEKSLQTLIERHLETFLGDDAQRPDERDRN